jgi:hypothetical protein
MEAKSRDDDAGPKGVHEEEIIGVGVVAWGEYLKAPNSNNSFVTS